MAVQQQALQGGRPSRDVGLPYGVGRVGAGWWALLAVLLVGVAAGIYGYLQQAWYGEVVTGLRNLGPMRGATWGLYVVFVVYFVGISFAGITIAALIRLLDARHLRPVARMAELLTVVSLVLAALSVLADLGQPLRGIVNLFRYARPQSPFFGTFSLVVSGYLFASLVYLYLDSRADAAYCARFPGRLQKLYRWWAAGYRGTRAERERHARASFWLAIAIVPLLVTAHSTLGFVFGLQGGRPGWFSALQPPAFVILAGVSGVGALIVIAAILRRVLGERERLGIPVFRWLSNLLMVLLAAYLYFLVVEWLTMTYAGPRHEAAVMRAVLFGPYRWIYWAGVVCLVVPFALLFVQFVLRRFSLAVAVFSGLAANVAAVAKRYVIVVPSQTHGALLPYGVGSYTPTWVEWAVVVGLFALGIAAYVVFMKVFPILDVDEEAEAAEPAQPERRPSGGAAGAGRLSARTVITWLLVVGGFALQAVSYFWLAAPIGLPTSPAYSNPRLPYAPALFVLGVVTVFVAALVYELLPEREGG